MPAVTLEKYLWVRLGARQDAGVPRLWGCRLCSGLGVEGAVKDVQLLLTGQFDEVDSIATDTDGEVRVVLWMLHSVLKSVSVEYVDVGVVEAFYSTVFLTLCLHGC